MSRRVAIVIPTLNEASHIGELLQLVSVSATETVLQILVSDGGSTDGTRDIVRRAERTDPRIRLIDNPQRLQSAGVNRAVSEADSQVDTIVRLDAHAHYPGDYVERILGAFEASGAQMVATRLRTGGRTALQRGIAAACNSLLGTGGSAHRIGGKARFVDHGHHAGIDRTAFERVGGYDETFVANEDAELDYRIRRSGGRIWLDPEIEVRYEPRPTVRALARQYWRYGCGRARTFLKHRERPRLRQMLPVVLVAALGASLVLAPLQPWLLIAPASYVASLALYAGMLAIRLRSPAALLAAPAAAIMHIAWGGGFLATLLLPRRGKSPVRGLLPQATSPQPVGSLQGTLP